LLAQVVERREPRPRHVELILEHPGLAHARPGQFAHVRTPGTLRRPLSFSRLEAGGRAGLLLRVVGVGTAWIAERQAGDSLDLLAPLGRGYPDPAPGPLVLVGGGVGVPPLHAAAQWWAAAHPTWVLLGARTADEVLMVDDFRSLGLEPLVATDDGSQGRRGLVTDLLAGLLPHVGSDVTVMACGPTAMLAAVGRIAAATRLYLAFEQRMGCGVGACLACVVPVAGGSTPTWRRVCRDGPVFRPDELGWREGDGPWTST
jgi:dihydroorotate dehydrogenase electron transfer subunit